MFSRTTGRRGAGFLVAACVVLSARAGWGTTPTVVWQDTGIRTGYPNAVFSADGTVVLLATSGGFKVRRASDGVLLHTVTLPPASQVYDAMAFSPDKSLVALSFSTNSPETIELWQVSSGTLQRTIATDAVRSMKGLDFSSTGLLASRERFAYGGGGYLRVFRTSDGTLVRKIGPVARNSSPGGVSFSPSGQYLAVNDTFSLQGLLVLRTSDWGTARSLGGTAIYSWSPDSGSLWTTAFERVRVSDGAILNAAVPLSGTSSVTAVTPDNRFLFAWDFAGGTASNTMRFLRTSDGGTQLVYTLGSGTVVWSNQVSSPQTLFTYEVCPSSCTVFVAKMPSL